MTRLEDRQILVRDIEQACAEGALADPPFTPPPKVIDEGRRQLRLPIANRLVAEFDAPDQEHLWQIAQAQLVAKPPEDHECDDVGWILSAIENSTRCVH